VVTPACRPRGFIRSAQAGAFSRLEDVMNDRDVVMHETGIDLADVPESLHDLTIKMCRQPLSVLMAVVEEIDQITDEEAKADMVRLLVERRMGMERMRRARTDLDRRASMERVRRRMAR
jgi:hypothetical protein